LGKLADKRSRFLMEHKEARKASDIKLANRWTIKDEKND
jgi:hypothetical protein